MLHVVTKCKQDNFFYNLQGSLEFQSLIPKARVRVWCAGVTKLFFQNFFKILPLWSVVSGPEMFIKICDVISNNTF